MSAIVKPLISLALGLLVSFHSPHSLATPSKADGSIIPNKKGKKSVRLGVGYGRTIASRAYGPFQMATQRAANESYLNDTKKNLAREKELSNQKEFLGFEVNMLEEGQIRAFKEEMTPIARQQEMMERYHLSVMHKDQVPEAVRQKQLDMGSRLVRQVGANTGKIYARRLRRAAENDPNLVRLRTPAAVIGGLVAVTQGEPVKWDVSNSTKVTAWTRVQETASQLDLSTPIVNSSFAFRGRVPGVVPWEAIPGQTDERMRLSLSRSVPWIDATSSMSYGTSSNTVCAGLSRPIFVPNLTATVDTIRTVGQRRLAYESDERVFLNYGISF